MSTGTFNFDLDNPSQPDVKALDEAISILLDLKIRMNLAECFYEIYIPKSDTVAVRGSMTDDSGGFAKDLQKCKLCLIPGVIEYSQDSFPKQELHFSESLIVRASKEERRNGRVASPAIVVFD